MAAIGALDAGAYTVYCLGFFRVVGGKKETARCDMAGAALQMPPEAGTASLRCCLTFFDLPCTALPHAPPAMPAAASATRPL